MKTDLPVLAKSNPNVTLKEHIHDCLVIFQLLQKILPILPTIAKKSNYWDMLYCSIFFHDFGKSHPEFQKILTNQTHCWYFQRHELYSIPFVEKMNLPKQDMHVIMRSILGHHKDFNTLKKKYIPPDQLEQEKQAQGWERHPHDFVQGLCSIKSNYSYLNQLMQSFPSLYEQIFKKPCPIQLNQSVILSDPARNHDQHPFKAIAAHTLTLQETDLLNWQADTPQYWLNFLVWAGTKICDHMGSAQVQSIEFLNENDFSSVLPYLHQGYSHQHKSGTIQGNCILQAPTGSGKTEAALLWIRKQIQDYQGRVWYILPYTASINAMYNRLCSKKGFGNDKKVNLFHSRAHLFFSTLLDDSDHNQSSTLSFEERKQLRDHNGLFFPLKIITPFQILKWFYGVKSYEQGLTQLAGSILIFDEIHAYDLRTFAQLLESIHFMQSYLSIRIFVMTATLPTFMKHLLMNVMNNPTIIHADRSLIQKMIRHRVHLLEGTILRYMDRIRSHLKNGHRIIIVLNTVERAQAVYHYFDDIPQKTMLHGRFNYRDRQKKENQLQKQSNQLLIGTQTIEVSLDIDYDMLYTEPAPLDALLQRFGRVNRRSPNQLKPPCPIFVCQEGGEFDTYIYPSHLIQKTIVELETIIQNQEGIIIEENLQEQLDRVYPCFTHDDQKKFNQFRDDFKWYLSRIIPYQSAKENEDAFYEQFSGIQVLPACFFNEYQTYIQTLNFVESEKLLVQISHGIYFFLKNNALIEKQQIGYEKKINSQTTIVHDTILIAHCEYNSQIGLCHKKTAYTHMDPFL